MGRYFQQEVPREVIISPGPRSNAGKRQKGEPMTTKEMLYLDDALSHAQFLSTQFQTAASQLQDASLRLQAQQMADRNRQVYRKFYNLV